MKAFLGTVFGILLASIVHAGEMTFPLGGGGSSSAGSGVLASDVVTWSSSHTWLNSSGIRVNGPVLASNGTANSPGLSFGSEAGEGIYLAAADTLGLAAGGTMRMTMSGSAIVVNQIMQMNNGSLGSPSIGGNGGNSDTGIRWFDTDNLEIGNASAATMRFSSDNSVRAAGSMTVVSTMAVLGANFSVSSPTFVVTGGNVGIGAPSPGATLEVRNAGVGVIISSGSTASQRIGSISFGLVSNDFAVFAAADRPLVLGSNGTNKAIIDTSGKVGIGTTSPISTLEINGDLRVGAGGTPIATISTGTYTPACTIDNNLDACTPAAANFHRIGNLVHVSGTVTLDPTAGGGATTRNDLTFPIATDCTGAGADTQGVVVTDVAQRAGIVFCDTTNDRATISFASETTASNDYYYSYDYVIK